MPFTFQKSQKYLFSGKNIKKILQLRCSNVLLYLKYKVLLCDPDIEFIILAGGKALETDHRETWARLKKTEREFSDILTQRIDFLPKRTSFSKGIDCGKI